MEDGPPLNPRALLFTLYGDYVHPTGEEEVRVGALVRLAEVLGGSPSALRSALSRMTREGWLRASRAGGRPRYGLSPRGLQLVDEGARRIYRRRRQDWDGRWLIAAYSLPERRRGERDRLREGLAFLGLGALGNGLFVTPHDLQEEVRAVAERTGALQEVTVLRGELGWPQEARGLVARAWDLEQVGARYRRFLDTFGHVLDDEASLDDEEAFRRRFHLTHAFRRALYGDPELPDQLLPQGWAGRDASVAFSEANRRLRAGAERFYRAVAEGSGTG